MSPSAYIRAAGLAALNRVGGEPLRYGPISGSYTPVTGICDRKFLQLKPEQAGEFNFTAIGFTNVEVLFSLIAGRPEVGSFFTDGQGVRHRIRYVSQTDASWFCYCTQSSTGDVQPSPIGVLVDDGQVVPVVENSKVVAWKMKDLTTGVDVTITIEDGQIVLRA